MPASRASITSLVSPSRVTGEWRAAILESGAAMASASSSCISQVCVSRDRQWSSRSETAWTSLAMIGSKVAGLAIDARRGPGPGVVELFRPRSGSEPPYPFDESGSSAGPSGLEVVVDVGSSGSGAGGAGGGVHPGVSGISSIRRIGRGHWLVSGADVEPGLGGSGGVVVTVGGRLSDGAAGGAGRAGLQRARGGDVALAGDAAGDDRQSAGRAAGRAGARAPPGDPALGGVGLDHVSGRADPPHPGPFSWRSGHVTPETSRCPGADNRRRAGC